MRDWGVVKDCSLNVTVLTPDGKKTEIGLLFAAVRLKQSDDGKKTVLHAEGLCVNLEQAEAATKT
jgi:hypothetical protein